MFSEKLIALRKTLNLSQEELGARVGVSRQTVSKWETGQTTPEMSKLIELVRLFDCTLDELVEPISENATSNTRNRLQSASYRNPSLIPLPSWNYTYTSKRKFLSLPLVHIDLGRNGQHRAKGIIAIGNTAVGIVAVGFASCGILSVGLVSAGTIALGCLAAGGLALGAVVSGIIALGGIAVGIGAAGGLAVGSDIAVGGLAVGKIAVGESVQGTFEFPLHTGAWTSAEVVSCIADSCPSAPQWLLELLRHLPN